MTDPDYSTASTSEPDVVDPSDFVSPDDFEDGDSADVPPTDLGIPDNDPDEEV